MTQHVLIVGGGIAGTSAALLLADAGVDAIRVGPTGRTTAEQIEHLEMTVDLAASAS